MRTKLNYSSLRRENIYIHFISIFILHCYFQIQQPVISNKIYSKRQISSQQRNPPYTFIQAFTREFLRLTEPHALPVLTMVRYLKHTTINQCSVKLLISPFGTYESHSRLIHICLATVMHYFSCCSNRHICPSFLCKQTEFQNQE